MLLNAALFFGGWFMGNAAYDAIVPQSIQKRIQSTIFTQRESTEAVIQPYLDVVSTGGMR
jgi:hypothetical protein